MKLRALLAVAVFASACDVFLPTNPFDPATPTDQQAPGHIVGRVLIEGVDLDAQTITLRLLDAEGRAVRTDVTTRKDADGLPAGFVDDGKGPAGTFDVEVAPGRYTIDFSAQENNLPQLFDASVEGIVVIPGGVTRADVRPVLRPADSFSGVVTGSITGAEPGRAFLVRLEALDFDFNAVLTRSADGPFRIDNVPPGHEYRVSVESDAYAPASSANFSLASTATPDQPVDAGTLSLVLMRNLFSVDHGASAAPFVNATTVPVVMDGSLLIINPEFTRIEIRAGVSGSLVDATSGWVDVDAAAVVELGDVEDGAHELEGQLRLCFQDPCDCDGVGVCAPPLLSGKAPLEVVLDREAPELLDLEVASVVRCTDFGSDCDDAATASPIALPISASLFDVTGRVSAFGVALDDNEPALTSVDAASLAAIDTISPAISPADADLAIRLFAKDAAGNVAIVGVRDVRVDVTPIEAVSLSVAGTASRVVDGSASTIVPGDLIEIDLEVADTSEVGRWEVVREGGALLTTQPGRAPYVGPVSAFVGGVHRESLVLRVVVEDDVGNVSRSDPFNAIVWRAGDASGTALFEGGARPAFTASLASSTTSESAVVSASTGAITFSEVPRGVYALRIEAPGFVTKVVEGIAIDSNVVTDLGVQNLALPRGALVGRFVLAGQESTLNNSGIQVSIVDGDGVALAAALTLADGTWRATDIPVGTGYTAVAFFSGFIPTDVSGLAVVEGVESVVRPDGGNAPTPIALRELEGDFSLCAPGGFLDDPCTPLLATNLTTVRVGGISAEGFSDFRVSKTAFPPDESGFQPFETNGAETVAPTISFSAPADERTVTVFLQLRAGPGNLGPVLESRLTFDATPPVNASIALRRGPGALKDGFTNAANVDVVLTANAGVGDVAPLGSGRVVFATTAPAAPTGTSCAPDVACAVPLDDLQERTHTAFGFACDTAGNCIASPVSAAIVRDVTAPRANNGVSIAPIGLQLSGGVFFTPSTVFTVQLGVGRARNAANAVVLDTAGNAVADVIGVRFGADARPAAGNGSFDFDALPFTIVDRPADTSVGVAGPGLPAVDAAFRVFAQYQDAAGNVSVDENIPNFFDVTRDSVAPVADVLINGGELYTRNTSVSVAVTADASSPPSSVSFSTDGLLTSTTVAFPLPLGTTVNLGAARADGPVTVTTRLTDAAGNTSDRSQALILDRAPPDVLVTCTSCTSVGGAFFSNANPATVILQIDADDGGELDTVAVTNVVTVPFASIINVPLSQNATNNLEVVVTDAAGNARAVPITIVHDRVAPVPTLLVNNNATFTNNATVTLNIGATGETPLSMRVNNGASAASVPLQAFLPLLSWPLDAAGGDGAKQVTVDVLDAAGNAGSITRSITLDTQRPLGSVSIVGGVTLANGTKVVTSTAIQAQLAFPADAVNHVVRTTPLSETCDDAPFPATPVAPPSTPVNLTLTPTAGADPEPRTVFACVVDRAGNKAFARTDFLLDQTRPSGALVVNGGAPFTTSTSVTVTLSDLRGDEAFLKKAIDVAPDCANQAGYTDAFTSSYAVTLPDTSGPHTVFACIKDTAGNLSAAPISDAIVLDRTAPTFAASPNNFRINDGAQFATSAAVTLRIPATDATNESGVTGMRFATGSPTFSGAFEAFADQRAFTLPNPTAEGLKTVCVEVTDGAGRTASSCDDITLDLAAPAGTVNIASGATFSLSTTVSVNVTGEANTRLALFTTTPSCDAVADASYVAFDGNETFATFALGAGDGVRTVFACFKDNAGRTGLASDTIIVDTAVPPAPDLQEPALAARSAIDTPTFRWSASAGADLYRITIKQGAVTVRGPVDVTTTEYRETSALPNGDYTWEVQARDTAGNGSAIAGPRALTIDDAPPSLPTGLAVSPATSTRDSTPTLSFNTSTDTQTAAANLVYRVQIAEDAGFSTIVRDISTNGITTATFSFTLQNALADGTYFWRISVEDQARNAAVATGPSFTIDTAPPAQPTIDALTSPTNALTPAITWSAVTGAADYHVVITQQTPGACNAGFSTINVNTPSTSITPTLVGGIRCRYRIVVHARDALQNESTGDDAEIIVDTVAPIINPDAAVFRINDGAQFTNNALLSVLTDSLDAVQMKLAFRQSGTGVGDPPPPVGTAACSAASFNFVENDFASAVLQPFSPVVTFPAPPNTPRTNQEANPPNACKFVAVKYFDDAGNSTAANLAGTKAVIRLDTVVPDAPRISTVAQAIDAASINIALAVDSADHLNFRYALRNGNADFVTVTPTNAACLTDPGIFCNFNVTLTQNAENRIQIRAIDDASNVSADDFVVVTEDSVPPGTVPNLQLTPGDRQVLAQWDTPAADVTEYIVHYNFKQEGAACPTTASFYTGNFAEQGASGIVVPAQADTTKKNQLLLTGMSNLVDVCIAVEAHDAAHPTNQPLATVGEGVRPAELPFTRIARLTAAQLGVPTLSLRALAMRNGLLYVAVPGTGGGLIELDASNHQCFTLTDPAAFASCTGLVKSAATLTAAEQIVLQGGYAFVADGTAGTRIFRIVEGAAPVLDRTVLLEGGNTALRSVAVAVSRNALVVGRSSSVDRGFNGRTDVYDLAPLFQTSSNPTFRTTIAQDLTSGDPKAGIFGVRSVDLQGDTLLANGILYDFNRSTFAVTKRATQCSPAAGDVARISGRTLYFVVNDNGLDNDFGVCHLKNTDLVGGQHVTVGRSLGLAANRLDISGPFVLAIGRGTLEAYDVTTRREPQLVGRYAEMSQVGNSPTLGSVAVDGAFAYVTNGSAGEIDVLQTGSLNRIEVTADFGEPIGASDACMIRDVYYQPPAAGGVFGQAEEAIIHLGVDRIERDSGPTGVTSAANVGCENDNVAVFFGDNNVSIKSPEPNGSVGAVSNFAFPAGVPNGGASAEAVITNGGMLRWPWLISAVRHTSTASPFGARELHIKVLNLVDGSLRSSAFVMEDLDGNAIAGLPRQVAVVGGNVYVAKTNGVFNGSPNEITNGVYRVAFNPQTGVLGAATATQVLQNIGISGLHPYGRRIFYVRAINGFGGEGSNTAGELRAQALPDPASWSTADAALTNRYAYEHPIMLSGPFIYMPSDLAGTRMFRMNFAATSPFAPTSASLIEQFDPGADAATPLMALNRLYTVHSFSSVFLFRAR